MKTSSVLTAALFICCLCLSAHAQIDYNWLDDSPHDESMAWSDEWKTIYRKADPEVLAIYRAFNRADDPCPKEGVDCFRMSCAGLGEGDTVFATAERVAAHRGCNSDYHRAPHTMNGFKRSLDGGHTWEPYIDVGNERDHGDVFPFGSSPPEGRMRGFAFLKDGDATYMWSRKRFWKTVDNGKTWQNLTHDHGAGTLKDLRFDPDFSEGGFGEKSEFIWFDLSKMIKHPVAGFMVFGQNRKHDPKHHEVAILYSKDGLDWEYTSLPLGVEGLTFGVGSAVLYDTDKIMLPIRAHWSRNYFATAKVIVHGPDKFSLKDVGFCTPIISRQNAANVDCIYNPKTDRFEGIFTNRGGSEPGIDNEHIGCFLFSIAKEDFEAGSHEWTYECTLFVMKGDWKWNPPKTPEFNDSCQDGGNENGGIIHNGKQKSFIGMQVSTSEYGGIYMLERTLDTPKLVAYLRSVGNASAK